MSGWELEISSFFQRDKLLGRPDHHMVEQLDPDKLPALRKATRELNVLAAWRGKSPTNINCAIVWPY